jgi:ATP-binding cassette, subfamily B, bacterial
MRLPGPFEGSRRGGFARLCAIAFAQAAIAAAAAFLVRDVFDRLVAPSGAGWMAAAMLPATVLALIALASAWLRYRERIEAEALGQDYVHAVRLRLYDRLATLPPRDLQHRSRGGHLLRFIGDLTALRQWVSLGLARLGVAAVTGVVALAALAVINPVLAATVAAVLGGGALVAIALSQPLRAAARTTRQRRARLAGDISERIAAMGVVQMFSQIRRERSRIKRRSMALRRAMVARARLIGGLRGTTEATTGIAVAAILLAGGYEVGEGRATLGAIVAAMSVLGFLTPALRDLSRVYEYWHGYRVAMERITGFLRTRPSVRAHSGAPDLPDGPGRIAFDNVAVTGVFADVSAVAEPGAVVAVVGANGAGKTTLISLVSRLIEPSAGRVLIDGHDLRHHSAASIRAAIGVVSPDLALLRGTIGRNIRYRRPDAPDDEVARVCRLCGVSELLARIPGAMEARVAEGGLNLSPGERQRIALARALLGAPRILILDEADASLDAVSARLIDEVLDAFDGTVLMVSHRAPQIARADVIWHIADRRLVEQGPAELLMSRDGPTRKLLRGPVELVA